MPPSGPIAPSRPSHPCRHPRLLCQDGEGPPEGRLSAEGYKILSLIRGPLTSLPLPFSSLPPEPVCTIFQLLFTLLTLLCLPSQRLIYFEHPHYLFQKIYLLSLQSVIMATSRHYYQPAAYPIHAPSKAPAPAGLYPISRVPGSPPSLSDASTTVGSRSSGGLTFSSAGDYDSSSASYSGVDVVDVLSDRMQDAFDPTPLDKGLARQAQT